MLSRSLSPISLLPLRKRKFPDLHSLDPDSDPDLRLLRALQSFLFPQRTPSHSSISSLPVPKFHSVAVDGRNRPNQRSPIRYKSHHPLRSHLQRSRSCILSLSLLAPPLDLSSRPRSRSLVRRPERLSTRRFPLVRSPPTPPLRGPFLYFAFYNGFGADQSAHLQILLDLAFQRGGVEVLAIRDLHGQVAVHLPYFHALEVLHLSDCDLSLPPGFQGFNKLLILELLQVWISNNDLQLLIDTLKQLSIFKCYLASDPELLPIWNLVSTVCKKKKRIWYLRGH